MKNILSRAYLCVLALLLCFSLSSCFDVNEAVSMAKDGSGKYSFILDFENNFAFKYAKDDRLKNKADSSLDVMIERAKNTKGISDVVKKVEGSKYSFKYHFENVEALNKAIGRQINGELQTLYDYEDGILTHYNILPIENAITKNGVTAEDVLSEEKSESKQSSIDLNESMFKNFYYSFLVQNESKGDVKLKESNLQLLEEATTPKRVFLTKPLSDFMMSEIEDKNIKTEIEIK